MEKTILRQKIINKRNDLLLTEVHSKSKCAAENFLSLPQYQKADTILVYLSYNNEIDTSSIIKDAWYQQKKVLVPVCQKEDKSLLLSELTCFSEIGLGTWNIPEPRKEFIRPTPPKEVSLAIIPGLAFDTQGYRLGYGAGYYDRFLPRLDPDCPLIALAYDFQVIEHIPYEQHDVPVDIIVTEKRIHKVRGHTL